MVHLLLIDFIVYVGTRSSLAWDPRYGISIRSGSSAWCTATSSPATSCWMSPSAPGSATTARGGTPTGPWWAPRGTSTQSSSTRTTRAPTPTSTASASSSSRLSPAGALWSCWKAERTSSWSSGCGACTAGTQSSTRRTSDWGPAATKPMTGAWRGCSSSGCGVPTLSRASAHRSRRLCTSCSRRTLGFRRSRRKCTGRCRSLPSLDVLSAPCPFRAPLPRPRQPPATPRSLPSRRPGPCSGIQKSWLDLISSLLYGLPLVYGRLCVFYIDCKITFFT